VDGAALKDEFAQNYKKIGLKVSYYRKLAGMTQEQLAEKMGVGTSFIGQIEAPNIYKAISMDTLIPPRKSVRHSACETF